jgi:eukaryotic-like serine/threonine-protein kinase
VNWRGALRRFMPYVIAIVGGFVLAYLVVAFFIFPAGIIPRDVKVPNVVGLDYADAAVRLEQAGFKAEPGETRFHSSAPKMTVLEQTPSAGATDLVGATVSLVVSGGQRMASVPSLVGMTQTEAERALENAGFDLGDVVEQPSPQPRGEVVESRPAAGTQVPVPSPVGLLVSAGPSVVLAPDVVGRNFASARLLLEQVGLAVGDVTSRDGSSADGAATVLSQSPAAGSQVARGARINLEVGGPR